jgi:hypothetical protein
MRSWFFAALLLTLAACDEARPAHDETPAPEIVLTGRYLPSSDTALHYTGGVSIERAGLVFDKGAILYTRVLDPRSGYDLTALGGDSYAAIVLGPSDLTIELRRVTQQTLREGAPSLCGEDRPQYVALAYEARAKTVTMLVFTGDEAPGPRATQSRLCATFGYAAPEGARTREGVVL